MIGHNHQIRRQILELEIEDQDAAWRIQSTAGSIYRRRLVPVIDQCLTECSPTERSLTEPAPPLQRIDSLAVDLGTVDAEHLEAELAAALETRLRQALKGFATNVEHRAVPWTESHPSESHPSESHPSEFGEAAAWLELLEMFVRTGRLPWWADTSPPAVIEEAVGQLLVAAPRRFAGWLRRLATTSSHELRRVVVHLGDERLGGLVALLAGGRASLSDAGSHGADVLMDAGLRLASGLDAVRLRHAVWDAILRTTAAEEVREVELFWHMVLARVTAETAVEGQALEAELLRTLASRTEPAASSLGSWARSRARAEAGGSSDPDAETFRQQLDRAGLDRIGLPDELIAELRSSVGRLPGSLRRRWCAALEELAGPTSGEHSRPAPPGGIGGVSTARVLVRLLELLIEHRLLSSEARRRAIQAFEAPAFRNLPSEELRSLCRLLHDAERVDQNALDRVALVPLRENPSPVQIPKGSGWQGSARESVLMTETVDGRSPSSPMEWTDPCGRTVTVQAHPGRGADPAGLAPLHSQRRSSRPAPRQGSVRLRASTEAGPPRLVTSSTDSRADPWHPSAVPRTHERTDLGAAVLDQNTLERGALEGVGLPEELIAELRCAVGQLPAPLRRSWNEALARRHAIQALEAPAFRNPPSAEAPPLADEARKDSGVLPVEAPTDLTWSDVDAAYVDNAGMVLLWPFLGHFFEHLELLEDKEFRDGEARQRAVGLLQYLVTEDPSPPEYQVTLGKVLCGLEVDAPFELASPVTEEEAAECSDLLTAVIAHAPIFKDISHGGLRASFLRRPGVLRAEGDSWLLTVERETYDVVVDRLPWSVGWIRLPWMEGAMRVEW